MTWVCVDHQPPSHAVALAPGIPFEHLQPTSLRFVVLCVALKLTKHHPAAPARHLLILDSRDGDVQTYL
jgi:hypothetical protein